MKRVTEELDPLHRLVLAYAKAEDRPVFALLFAFDSRLAEIIRSTSETLIGQMRLTWWRDVLTKPYTERPVGEPFVEAMNRVEEQGGDVLPMLRILDGWEVLLEDFPWDDRHWESYSQNRGEGLFAAATKLSDDQRKLAQAWALWDFARHCSDDQMRETAFHRCSTLIESAGDVRFDRNGRPYSILCKLAERDVRKGRLSDNLYRPSVASRIIWHGLTGL